ncbi:MAG TPA: hypothetical protein VGL35_08150 [Rhizomicrobium sp.]
MTKRTDVYIGFDSAWGDKQKGAICALSLARGKPLHFVAPHLVTFREAHCFIHDMKSSTGNTLIALDQPTIVRNSAGMRPVERVAASLVSWLGGGVQPANLGRLGMFCDASPIWPFLGRLGALEDPERARYATGGFYLIEVFPALALASFDPEFFGLRRAPKYNPGRRKTFRTKDWIRVASAAARLARTMACEDLARWCDETAAITQPRKADQDRLDSAICVLIALHWRLRPRAESIVLGDLDTGYMVLPASADVRERLDKPARKHSVPIDACFRAESADMTPGAGGPRGVASAMRTCRVPNLDDR